MSEIVVADVGDGGPQFRRGIWNAVNLAVSAVERQVAQLDKWADENAAKGDYSSAGSQQKSAVDLHAAVAIIKETLVPHTHDAPGFRYDLGDRCEGCAYDDDIKRRAMPATAKDIEAMLSRSTDSRKA